MRRFVAIFAILIAILPALAQDKPDAEQEKSALLTYVEEQLSTPNRKISFWGIEGVLSSDAKVARITIADRESVWLEINDAEIVWTRSALLTGRLVVDSLKAASIEIKRQPLPDEGAAPSPEASTFSVPELPVSVNLDELAIESVTFGEDVFGLASELSVAGNIAIDGEALNAGLEIERLDGPGGSLDLKAAFSGETNNLDIDLSLAEPEDGVLANLLNFANRPAVSVNLRGSGPVSDLTLALTMDANERRVLTGQARFAGTDQNRRFDIGAAGPIGDLVRSDLRDLFGSRSELILAGKLRPAGGLHIERLAVASGALELNGSMQTAADGFPLEITLDGTIQSRNANPVVLPLPGGDTSVGKAEIAFRFGGSGVTTWSGRFDAADFESAGLTARQFVLDMGGAAIGLENPATREVTFVLDAQANGLGSDNAAIAEAVGDRIAIDGAGTWNAANPITIDRIQLNAKALRARFSGLIDGLELDGRYTLDVEDAAVLSAMAQRELAGNFAIAAQGSVQPVSGGFDLSLDGTLIDAAFGTQADGLFAGTTAMDGRLARDETGLSADRFALVNDQMALRANGRFGSEMADFNFDAQINELKLVSEQMSGQLTVTGSARGSEGSIDLAGDAQIANGTVVDRRLTSAALTFRGNQTNGTLTGNVSGTGFLDGERVDVATGLSISDEERVFNDLQLVAGATRLTGSASLDADSHVDARLALKSADISTAAALFLIEASGKAQADIVLSAQDGKQGGRVAGTINALSINDMKVGEGRIDLTLSDLYGLPGADGDAELRDVIAAGIEAETIRLSASQRGNDTSFEAGALLDNGASVETAGSIVEEGGAYRLTLTRADLVKGTPLVRLAGPASVLVLADGFIVDAARLDIGGGVDLDRWADSRSARAGG